WNKLLINLPPPRLLALVLFAIPLAGILAGRIGDFQLTGIGPRWWLIVMLLYVCAMLLSIPAHLLNGNLFRALLYLPRMLGEYLAAAAGIRPKRREFVHTPKRFQPDQEQLPDGH